MAQREKNMSNMKMVQLAPVMVVEEIELCLPFWTERLGFAKAAEVPEGTKLGFVMLVKDGVTVMYQTRASVAQDVPALANEASHSFLFITVNGIDEIMQKLGDVPVVIPLRKTFYGAKEIGVREPGGNVITFAEFEERPQGT